MHTNVCVCPRATRACVFYGFWSSGNMTKRSINEATYLSCRQKRLLCVLKGQFQLYWLKSALALCDTAGFGVDPIPSKYRTSLLLPTASNGTFTSKDSFYKVEQCTII